jgi:hypothetical protein
MSAWCERWHIKINEIKTQAIYFSHQRRVLISTPLYQVGAGTFVT